MKTLTSSVILFIILINKSIAGGGVCSDLFFSEYLKGSSNNKALEIYNPTKDTVDLSKYSIKIFYNGATTGTSIKLSGKLAPKEVFITCHSSADSAISNKAGLKTGSINYNGNDAVALLRDTIILDLIGQIGYDPGANGWAVDSGSTIGYTLVRKKTFQEGDTLWANNKKSWIVYSLNTYTYLGSHTMDPCGSTSLPEVSLHKDTTVNEDADSVKITLSISSKPSADVKVKIENLGGDAKRDTDFVYKNNAYTFPSGSTASIEFYVKIIDDKASENTEKFKLGITSVGSAATLSKDSVVTVNIIDNDTTHTGITFRQGLNSVQFYPIPVREKLYLLCAETIINASILDVNGRIMQTGNLSEIDVSALPQGIYSVKVETRFGVLSKRFIKMN